MNLLTSYLCLSWRFFLKNIEHLNNLLIAYNPTKILGKGYAIIEDEENNILTSKTMLEEEKKLNIILKDGKVKGSFIPLE